MFVKLYKTSLFANPNCGDIDSDLVAHDTGKIVNVNNLSCIEDYACKIGNKLYHKIYFVGDNITDSTISYNTYVIDDKSYRTMKNSKIIYESMSKFEGF